MSLRSMLSLIIEALWGPAPSVERLPVRRAPTGSFRRAPARLPSRGSRHGDQRSAPPAVLDEVDPRFVETRRHRRGSIVVCLGAPEALAAGQEAQRFDGDGQD
ncbi:MAG: hypothetical protein H0W72_18475 [Planctomycetes bacterium]|nr:hypothetical protein [Planctomycetota bacterium]